MKVEKESKQIQQETKDKPKKQFWELNLNPITMWEPIRDNYLETTNKTKKYYNKTQSI
jgi:CRISPR/Cas system-associated protein Cas10 (large subunit of type III CRISPR-Cas system)